MIRRLFVVFAWLLTALWLPATLHCTAETAGWFDPMNCCDGEATSTSDVAFDHCETLESGAPREELGARLLSVPVVALLEILRPALVAEPTAANGVTPWAAAPLEIGGLWRVTERVVAAAQAP